MKLPAETHLISFGDNVFIGTHVSLITHNMANSVFNNMSDSMHLSPQVGTIEIGDNVFIGANATIMYGVKIGSNVIVVANAVVTKDVPDGTVVVGIPAKSICCFIEQLQKCIDFNESFKESTKNTSADLWTKQETHLFNNER